MFSHFKKLDWSLIIIILLLNASGLLAIKNTSEDLTNFYKQILFIGLGLFLMLFFSFLDYRILKNNSLILIVLYLVCLFLLGGLFFWGREIRGAASWFKFGFLNFQPIELAKIIIILILAKYFSLRHIEMYRIRHIITSGVYVGLPTLLVLFQPDLGSVVVLGSVWLGIMLMAGIKMRHLIILTLIAAVLITSSWFWLLKDYQKQRILTFINPGTDPYGSGYNLVQSLIAIGSGGLFGRGLGQGSQSQLKFLPEHQTDFIFAAIAEQGGLVGVVFLLTLFAFLFWRIIRIALSSLNNFSRLFAVGLVIMLFSQTIINIGMNMGVLPITGLTLPLVSYGGSSLLTIFLGLGILQSIKARS
ncbi:MAG: rod shape-determining protein RodA [Candidatus Portnoybacteria bacterium RIFCSPLOWO2_12_FULL_39_9]|uniref:Rod shape-determining protein RodA n=1 Tax=Candidatus Portnoybacteria bacterium RIFCSPHIGHO2_12_FULL_38_9 TaxID=1801997 RepID=A0A1G2FHV6_9BACT|nr:MAG: rod shape-determining protein RodA [Candidatus Portnoybacteria bacterium RBG_13_40_8]OGZ36872.1 MAG: rod shape-determining protein RodA [Candidatus Portnoybacteria bacterium RIFCSPHIGHO2_02_FULL_39_12]OGZ37626.1 MAG: rod shape-determining protein RodA [Candidatus Portnoybacteria bacterium RIFCSPHIGHO2_12_FULL_38_9]OGZ39541.1 MAG: rod shape-determining protein RodA [Candidatus Portnoybacteria bacterium RIFCSPLOWO2_01_FULL_38_39]OGZ39625.1 MAG: rod shape-determining protein RodA [Candidat